MDHVLLSGGYCFYHETGDPGTNRIEFWFKDLTTQDDPVYLGSLNIDAMKYWCEPGQAAMDKNTFYISVGYKTSLETGDVFEKAYLLSGDVTRANSLKIEKELLSAPAPELPRFFFDIFRKPKTMEHIPSDVWVDDRSLYIQEDSEAPKLLVRDFLAEMADPWSESIEILEKRGDHIYAVRNVQVLETPSIDEQGVPVYDLKKTEYVQIDIHTGEEQILDSKEIAMLAYVYSSYQMGYVFRVEEVYVP